jgi:hypothetical protein
MADTYHVTYEYTNGNSINFRSNDLTININRPFMRTIVQPDGGIYVHDPDISQLVFTGSAILSGDDMDTLHSVQVAGINYSGDYPRITVINWDGDSTETNIEVVMTQLRTRDRGRGWWQVFFEFTGKTKGDT